ncbi:phosphopantetheine-binding protein [Paenibacillus sp. Y412MC10]|uniref:phosphopantetheine-binding protein n=1 Tax=Geobacillus sp. (strain Y412MC10) TaxID=481743 RepID=UPI001642ECBD|nr:phosphopantetheine-binding protein [Paenibacillus sp. Y412MC10]
MTNQSAQVNSEYTALLHTFQELQKQTADAHIAHQQFMATGHAAFLRAAEATFTNLSRLISGELSASYQHTAVGEAVMDEQPLQSPKIIEFPHPNATNELDRVHHIAPPPELGQTDAVQPVMQPTEQPAAHSPVAPSCLQSDESIISKQPPQIDFQQLLYQIVADKTGYPLEMLELDMDLESGLGIDSIKRVEILSALQEQLPSSINLNPTEMTALRTLGEIVDYMRKNNPNASTQSPIVKADIDDSSSIVLSTKLDAAQLLIDIVSDKTGYPIEMIDLSMEMESELGIDSIKRVEIFSALQDQLPKGIKINSNELTVLRTLGEIASYVEGSSEKK